MFKEKNDTAGNLIESGDITQIFSFKIFKRKMEKILM